MLKEWKDVRQRPEEGTRRWFSDAHMDLIVWYDGQQPREFQLCYDKSANQRALLWKPGSKLAHMRVDDGENRPGTYKGSAVLSGDGDVDLKRVVERFTAESGEVDPATRAHVLDKLAAAAHHGPDGS